MAFLGVDPAEKIDGTRHDGVIGQLKRARTDQDFRTIKAVRYAKTPRELNRLAQDKNVLLLLRWCCDHRTRTHPDVRSSSSILPIAVARTFSKSTREIERGADCLFSVIFQFAGKSKNGNNSFT